MAEPVNFQYEIERLKTDVMILSYCMDIRCMTFDAGVRLSVASELADQISKRTSDLSVKYYEYLNGIRKRVDEPVP